MTQEEFEKIVNKTCEMSLNGEAKKAVAFWKNNGAGEIEIESDVVWTKVYFIPYDTDLKSVTKVMPDPNAKYLFWSNLDSIDICEEFSYLIREHSNDEQARIFSISDLETIQGLILFEDKNPNDIFLEDCGDCFHVSPDFLLVNPRKDVVEWALKTFNFNHDVLTLVEKCQAIPELKELILNTLEKKGE